MTRALTPVTLLSALLLATACSGGGDEQGRRRLFSREAGEPASEVPAFDWSRPEAALAMDAGEAARRIGSFEWTAAVDWTVSREGDPPRQVHVTERHRVRQAASGEFEAESELDPGEGPASRSGRTVVYAGGVTYARSLHAPFGAFRTRPTDRGRDARRFRDESYGMLADLARLAGPAFRIEPAGDTTVQGRAARRFDLTLAKDAAVEPAAMPPVDRVFGQGGPDEDTLRRLRFLEGQVPLAAKGELVADAATGAPLRVHLRATFGVRDDPKVRAQVELRGGVRALGGAVAAIAAPKDALPDERKPPGVSDALEAAGLKGGDAKAAAPVEPPDEE
jgi:hypothetical protein